MTYQIQFPHGQKAHGFLEIVMNKYSNFSVVRLIALSAIIVISFLLRIYGINWDQNQHLHPDERFLTMAVDEMTWPKSLSQYLSPSTSKLNPYNIKTSFFVYGTLPTTLVKYFSGFDFFEKFQYNNIALTGRLFSAIFDAGSVILIYFISKTLFDKRAVVLLASFLYAISILPIQLSHFFTVDTLLNFFLVLSFYFLIKLISNNKLFYGILLGLSFGAALACKISALYFLPVMLLGHLILVLKDRNILRTICYLLLAAIFTFLSFRILDSHVFSGNLFPPKISPQFIQNIKELKFQGTKDSLFPPAIQWLKITPLIFPLKNIILWGLGLPLGILTTAAVLFEVFKLFINYLKAGNVKNIRIVFNNLIIKGSNSLIILFWILLLFIYQGVQFSPTMRYFLPIYPFFAIVSAKFSVYYLFPKFKSSPLLLTAYYLLLILWPLSFLAIYSKPHSRVTASEWIYKNIPQGATISCDLWDDCLPLGLDKIGTSYQYNIITMEPFAQDTQQKISNFEKQLAHLDYFILTSNRAWGSISKVPEKYPFMSQFYKDLFSGKLNFIKVAEITSYPTIPILNVQIPNNSSEEAFTVYDHPKVIIYKNK